MKHLTTLIQSKFDEIQKTGKLFRVNLTGQQIWDLYLGNFPKEQDPIFRDPTSSSHNCNHCKNFIRRYGNIVALDSEFRIVTMFDINIEDEEYAPSMKAMADAIKASSIESVFFETYAELQSLPYEACKPTNSKFRLGIDKNTKMYTKAEVDMYKGVETDKVYTFNHFHLDIPKAYVDSTGKSVEAIMGAFRDPKSVLKRGLDELPLDTLELVRDLINQDSLLDGRTHLYKVEGFIKLKKEYDKLDPKVKDNWCWIKSQEVPFAKFKGELIGVLCTDLAEGKGLNESCLLWNKRADPVNFMKVTAPYTERQRKEASDLIEREGYTESFSRRFATLEDIKISEILHANAGDGRVKSLSILDGMKSPSTRHKKSEFTGIEEVSIDKFMSDILPNATSVEVYLESRLESNMVSLTTSCNSDSKPMFKWDNNYSWTFNGNLAGKSEIKEAVKLAGDEYYNKASENHAKGLEKLGLIV